MDLKEILLGLITGILSGFFIIYSLQFEKAYPEFILNILYYPYIIFILLGIVCALFFVDDRIAMLLLLIIIIFIIDMYLLGKHETDEEKKD